MNETKTKSEQSENEEDKKEKKTLSLSGNKKTLSLKGGTSTGQSRQSQGRGSSHVAVEVKKRRSSAPAKSSESRNDDKTSQTEDRATSQGSLTESEKQARTEALKRAMQDGKNRQSQSEEKEDTSDESNQIGLSTARTENKPREVLSPRLQKTRKEEEAEQEEEDSLLEEGSGDNETGSLSYRERLKLAQARQKTSKKETEEPRKAGRITITQALNEEYDRDRGPSMSSLKRAREKAKKMAGPKPPPVKIKREIVLPEFITVQELSNRMAERSGDIVKSLMKMGVMATINQTIDADTAELLIDEFGHITKRVTEADVEHVLEDFEDKEENLEPRPPIVTIMGHVDHGKTSLLDALRKANVVSGEAGGITQHIGAYQIEAPNGGMITFLDTPGHEAFTEMRARGANVTDIVVLVVAANDSVMPQTIEAIKHAKAAKVPIIVAINKIDLPEANPQKIKQDLLSHEIVIEEMGGEVLCVEVSAKQNKNLDNLLETIGLQSEILELKANRNRSARGTVIEAKQEQGRGNVASVLIQKGTLEIGDIFVVGSEWGRVRAINNDKGNNIDKAVPGQPVEILGLNGAPQAGDQFIVVEDENRAREISEFRHRKLREASAAALAGSRSSFEQMLQKARESKDVQSLPIIIKADVHGSLEALSGSLQKMSDDNEGISADILHSGVGGITESDVQLANASNALIIGFNVRANPQARELANRESVDIRYYNIIYNVLDDVKGILGGMLSPIQREEYIGQAEIRQVFTITKVGKVAGCMVTGGEVRRGSKVRLLRDNVVIHEGMLKTLKRFKDEVKEVKEGMECGMAFESYDDIKEGDIIECYELIEETRTIQ